MTISSGWQMYLNHGDSNQVMGGASKATIKRYSAVRDKHVKYCSQHGIETWQSFDEPALRLYGNWLAKSSADRTVYLELTLLKSINSWLINQKLLPAAAKLVLPLKKPRGLTRTPATRQSSRRWSSIASTIPSTCGLVI